MTATTMNTEALAGTAIPAPSAQAATARMLADWRGRAGVVVFGAGAHTHKILPVLEAYQDRIVGVVDDAPVRHGTRVGRWFVRAPGELVPQAGGALISSDTQQEPLAARVRAEFGERVAVLTLYAPSAVDAGPRLPFTGERQVGRTIDEIELGHRARYYWALQHLPAGAHVLDAACGNGYGSYILAQGGARVLAVDVAGEAVAFARHHYADPRITYAVAALDDPAALARVAQEFGTLDAVVSLETLEHLSDPAAFLRAVAEWLRPGGQLLCSTPNDAVMDLEDAPFHRQHFTVDQMLKLMAGCGLAAQGWFGQEGLQILPQRCVRGQRYVLYRAVRPQ